MVEYTAYEKVLWGGIFEVYYIACSWTETVLQY